MFRALQRHPGQTATPPLLGCPRCQADALCPTEWETFGDGHWLIWMRCGACGESLDTLVDNRAAAALDLELDRQQAQIAAQADALAHDLMAAEVEAFTSRLGWDLVDASDFAR